MGLEKTTPDINVYFINTINTNALNYGATLTNEYLSLVDNNNVSAFGGLGALYIKQMQPLAGIGNYWQPFLAGTAGVITIQEPSSLAANTTYGFILYQYLPATSASFNAVTQQNIPATPQTTVNSGGTLFFTTGATAPSSGTVVAAFQSLLANMGFQVTTALSGLNNTILTITAKTGFYNLYTNATGSVGNLTVTQAVQGVLSNGYTYDMNDFNQYGSPWATYSGYVSTNVYSRFSSSYTDIISGNTVYIFVFVNSGDVNYGNTNTGFVYSFVNNALAMGGVFSSGKINSIVSLLQAANALENQQY